MTRSEDMDDFLIARVILGAAHGSQLDEREIGREFDAPRAGVRASLTRLVENGLIKRERRVGTVPVNQRWIFDPLTPPTRAPAHTRRFQTRSVEQLRAPDAICRELGLPDGSTVARINRVEVAGERVLQSWVGWTTVGYDHWLSRVGEFDSSRWHTGAREVTGLDQIRVRRTFSTVRSSSADAELFGVDEGSPLNFTEIVLRDPDGGLIMRGFGRAPSQYTVTVVDTLVPLE